MTDDNTGTPPPDDLHPDYAIEGDDLEVEAPRRAASAEFKVEGGIGSDAALREAMDPAHQSLTEALRLSYRVLQAVMIVLVVLFVFSGIQTVREGETGVKLRLGRIQERDGDAALAPGPHFSWPYPIGEYVTFPDKGRVADIGEVFWPGIRPGRDLDEMIEGARASGILKPGRDGYLLTAGGDIGHLKLTSGFRIDGVGDFVSNIDDSDPGRDADRIVSLALQRSAVHAAARMELRDLVDIDDAWRLEIRNDAQSFLDELATGVVLDDVQTPDNRAALAIEKEFRDLQVARVNSDRVVQQARQTAEGRLIDVAGESWSQLLDLIDAYERAYDANDEVASAARLEDIRLWLTDQRLGGTVASTIQEAKAYESMVESTLGADAKAFEGLREAYHKNPDLIVASLWLDAYAAVLTNDDVEVIRVPANGGRVTLRLKGSSAVQDIRTQQRLRGADQRNLRSGFDPTRTFIEQRGDVRMTGPGRQLEVEGDAVSGRGEQDN